MNATRHHIPALSNADDPQVRGKADVEEQQSPHRPARSGEEEGGGDDDDDVTNEKDDAAAVVAAAATIVE